MRAVVQRVSGARVRVDGAVVGEIGHGLVVFVGVEKGDAAQDATYVASKVAELRIFNDEAGKMNQAVTEVEGHVLLVSQFTLHGDCRRGRRPSFDLAEAPGPARTRYADVARHLRERGLVVAEGVFQAMMHVELVGDGPVTILLDSRKGF
ncbi:MAG: D-tyrosyl-tRNA(Tyr) deacylase [Luteitalea sp.]|nr:D-tyrosyl-tRNA(Tyr) deacylase [Luteitalea sp.]